MAVISIIVPCYNVEKYIGQCISSIIRQTYKDIEIICINDGSTDKTLEILRHYEAEDNRIKVITGENGGYGKAVNVGISVSTGTYIGIVESDDFISENMYRTLIRLSLDYSVDVIKGNFWDYYDKTKKLDAESIVNTERHNMPDVHEPFTIAERSEILWGHPSVWSAIYRKEFLRSNNIKFMEVKGGGWVDNPFFFETISKAKSIMWTKEPLYYYRKTRPDSSSNMQTDPSLPFIRMMDNLDVFERNGYPNIDAKKMLYARSLVYLFGAIKECNYDENFNQIHRLAKELMQKLDPEVLATYFNLTDQTNYFTYASPVKTITAGFPRVLIYNWLPFDNNKGLGGGVSIYCMNLIKTIINRNPGIMVYFLSCGYTYDATTTKTFIRKTENIYGDRCHSFEVVNSPIPAEQRFILNNPTIALENTRLKSTISDFIAKMGPFEVIHFNNIEGLSLDILDLKTDFPRTKFIYSIHNYIPICLSGFYFQRHTHINCNPSHTAEDCAKCIGSNRPSNLAIEIYSRGLIGTDNSNAYDKKEWLDTLGLTTLDDVSTSDEAFAFAKTATRKINSNIDQILAVSRRVFDIAADNGIDKSKMAVSYIGTVAAKEQVRRSTATSTDGIKIVFLGLDKNYEEKGYPFLLDALSRMDKAYASKIDVVLTLKNHEYTEIYALLHKFRSVKIIQGYTHRDLPYILKDCNLGIIPVLWEDNLPQIAIEMVSFGVPILSSSFGGASELCDSDAFKFQGGKIDDFVNKLVFFLKNPVALNDFWKYHHGLTTMDNHWDEMSGFYGVNDEETSITFSAKDYAFLLREREFLRGHLSATGSFNNDQSGIIDSLDRRLKESEVTINEMAKQIQDMNFFKEEVERIKGSITYRIGNALTFIPKLLVRRK